MASCFCDAGLSPADRAFGAQRISGGRAGRRFAPPFGHGFGAGVGVKSVAMKQQSDSDLESNQDQQNYLEVFLDWRLPGFEHFGMENVGLRGFGPGGR